MSFHIQVRQEMLHGQIYIYERSAEKFNFRTQLAMQLQN